MQVSRVVFAAVAWLFVGLVVLQVFYAGVGLLGGGSMTQHRELGYFLSLVPLLILIAAGIGRTGQLALYSAGLLVITIVQTMLPLLGDDLPFVAALHPVNALAIFWLGLLVARRATTLARQRVDVPAEAVRSQPTAT